jgi:serine/threonine protein kinase
VYLFNLECQGGSNRIKGYSTQKNDIWSLGIILINLTAGRNPWKQANTRNTTFANYVRNPKHFFRTILPCISDELERILLRIFCLNPAKRISLPELRHYVLKCQSFVVPQHYAPPQQQEGLIKLKKKTQHMAYTDSIAQTMLHYVDGYTDDN